MNILNLSAFLLLAWLDGPASWPAFLGQGATQVDASTIPLSWSPEKNISWQTDLPGKGQSSPVIWGQTIFVTSIEGTMKENCHLLAINLEDGAIRWQQTTRSPQPVRSTYTQSRSAPTPVVDAQGVYAFYETGAVVGYDHSGNLKWNRNLTEDYGPFESTIGLAASPVGHEHLLYVLVDHEGPSYLLALDKQTGETAWITERTSRTSYASPAVVPVGDAHHLVCSSSGSIDGYDPMTGELLWSYEDGVGGNRSGAPVAFANGMFTVSASPGMHNEREEQARNTNFLMRINKEGATYQPEVLWRNSTALPSFNSPLVHQSCAYWVNNVGVVYCFDAESGDLHFAKRTNGVCWTTPVGIGDRIYLFGKDGITTVISTGPEFNILAENSLWVSERSSRQRPVAEASDSTTSPDTKESAARRESSARPSPNEQQAEHAHESDSGSNVREARFADPVQYGVAIVNGSLIVRTGSVVYCLRDVSGN